MKINPNRDNCYLLYIFLSCLTLSRCLNAQEKALYLNDTVYLADPSAHLFNGKLYIYSSHDIETNKNGADGDHFDMKDSRVMQLEFDSFRIIKDYKSLDIRNISWANRQIWAPDCACRNGIYYLYFPAKDKEEMFRIGVATSKNPEGPFNAEKDPIAGSYSIDPAIFKDSTGEYYLYFGGLQGGQLQLYRNNKLIKEKNEPQKQEDALCPKVAKLTTNMLQFAEPPRDVKILDENGIPLKSNEKSRRFFEGAWVHKYNGKYYFSYSTGTTHLICYAVGDNPYGPFIYKGVILTPVIGWTTHHSIIQVNNKWFLFYHDSKPSGGKSNLRSLKYRELKYNVDGSIQIMNGLD